MTGRTVSHYLILEKLGQGGMGVVYQAEDTRLKRTVAVKFLPAGALASEDDKARFWREAQAAASLDHPNICTIHQIDEYEGQPFLVMAYIDGQNLRDRVKTGPLKLDLVCDLASQAAEGLREAHRKGVVHRDIKSANLMVTPQGQVKIMDFGLAQLAGQARLTLTGAAVGTPAYMAPEQATGDPVDHRADLWSLGVVLHEMVTGQLPFRGSDLAVVHAILYETPTAVTSLRSGVPLGLEWIILKALAKRPDERYQHADDLLADLRALRRELESGATTRPAAAKEIPSVAVLPFVNLNRDEESEFFSDGITDEIINALSKVQQLRVVSRSSAFQFKGRTPDIREVGEKLKVGKVLEGSVRRAGSRVRVTAQLVNIADGFQVWSERYDRELKDVFDIQDEISRSMVEALRIKLVGEQQERLVARGTENLEAYNLYLRGLYYSNRWLLEQGIACLEQAIAAAPNYAAAHAALAGTIGWAVVWGVRPPKESWPQIRAAASRAVELDPDLGAAWAALGQLKGFADYQWEEAERDLRRAVDLSPGDAQVRLIYANHLMITGRNPEAEAEARRALEIDPLSPYGQTSLGWVLWFSSRFEQAIAQGRRALDLDPHYVEAYLLLLCAYSLQGSHGEAIATGEKLRSLVPDLPSGIGLLGWSYGRAGRRAEAEKLLAELNEMGKRRYVATYRGWIHYGLGDVEACLDGFEESYENRDQMLTNAKVNPVYEGMRQHPRFVALMKKIGLS